jgi:hypothetical protein
MPSSKVLKEFKKGTLHSGSKSGPLVRSKKQAVAIMLSERRDEQAEEQGRRFHVTRKPR